MWFIASSNKFPVPQGKARQGQGKARQDKILSGKCCVARSCPHRPCRPLPAAAAGCVRHDEPPPACAAPSLSPCACAGRAGTHTGQHGHRISSVQAGHGGHAEPRLLPQAATAARGGLCVLPGEEIEQRACGGAPAERIGRAERAQEPAPPQEPSPRTWAARRCRQLVECTAACLRAASMRVPRAALSARRLVDTRAPRSRWQPAAASARTALSCRYGPPHALRTNACSLACSALCAPSAHSLMSVLAVSPRPRKGLLTLSSLPHQLCQVRADGPI